MRVLMFVCVLGIQQATAQGVPAAVAACMDEHDPTKRLACYDREVPRAVTLRSSSSAGASAPSSAREPSPEEAFGMTQQLHQKETGQKSVTLDKMAAHVTAIAYKPRGELIVRLDNGQVWEEAETSSHLDLHPGDEVTIRKGMLGAFYMSSRQVPGLRVKRTQ